MLFGETAETTNNIDQNARFPGQYLDEESSYAYNYYRDYDLSTGRYVQSDPIGILRDYSDPSFGIHIRSGINFSTSIRKFGLNQLYGYAIQNPIKLTDPSGLDVICGQDAVWIPTPENGHGTGYCRESRNQGNQCGSGECAAFPPSKNDSCVKKCVSIEIQSCVGAPSNKFNSKDAVLIAACSTAAFLHCRDQTCDKCDSKYRD